jgi:hypothetical protein
MSRVGMTSSLFASWVETSIPISRNTRTAFGSISPAFRPALKTCVLDGRSFLAMASAIKLRQSLSRTGTIYFYRGHWIEPFYLPGVKSMFFPNIIIVIDNLYRLISTPTDLPK